MSGHLLRTFIFLLCITTSTTGKTETNDELNFSVSASYGFKQLDIDFITDEQPELESVKVSFVGAYKGVFYVFTLENAVSASKIQDLGVEGTIDRRDVGATIGTSIFESIMPEFENIILSPFVYIGYSYGKTEMEYIDGLGIKFIEAGLNAGLGISILNYRQKIIYTLMYGRAQLNNSELEFSQPNNTKKTNAYTYGHTLEASITYYFTLRWDIVGGVKVNNYFVNFETAESSSTARDQLKQLYIGIRYYF